MKELSKRVLIDQEVVWDKKSIVMSKTDNQGNIEYANEAFVQVSGYEDYELVSQPHNIIRHPHMPKVIFKMLWENLKEGKNFHGVVKNLAKSGRFYWMITDFEIIRDNRNNITNYIAKRQAMPEDALRKHIEPLYKKLLQIEEISGVDGSEKYLKGFLEEKKMTYASWVRSTVENKSFFKKLFGR